MKCTDKCVAHSHKTSPQLDHKPATYEVGVSSFKHVLHTKIADQDENFLEQCFSHGGRRPLRARESSLGWNMHIAEMAEYFV
jgi:hypothetical protein